MRIGVPDEEIDEMLVHATWSHGLSMGWDAANPNDLCRLKVSPQGRMPTASGSAYAPQCLGSVEPPVVVALSIRGVFR